MIATVLLIAVITAVLVPLIRRDLARSEGRRAARRRWLAVFDRMEVRLDVERRRLGPEEFAREHLGWWADNSGVERARTELLSYIEWNADGRSR